MEASHLKIDWSVEVTPHPHPSPQKSMIKNTSSEQMDCVENVVGDWRTNQILGELFLYVTLV